MVVIAESSRVRLVVPANCRESHHVGVTPTQGDPQVVVWSPPCNGCLESRIIAGLNNGESVVPKTEIVSGILYCRSVRSTTIST